MKNPKIEVNFNNRILSVKFFGDAIIDVSDLEEIYGVADLKSGGKPYCTMFEAVNHYEVTEAALEYLSDNPNNKNILAKAYVINSKEAEIKTKFHLLFDHPTLKPFTFKNSEEARLYLNQVISKSSR